LTHVPRQQIYFFGCTFDIDRVYDESFQRNILSKPSGSLDKTKIHEGNRWNRG
jgi:hypothetical protein